ncbi:hypothetical protein HELRODRAFT_123056, partial [Helobdella robusta]|uniref:Ig-like domain-containing protein n=1 Tax=Helobdella robusta TaxID=6412 RepID=T1EGW7_HELRO
AKQNVTSHQGDRAMLTCIVSNLGTKSVSWKRQGDSHPLTIGNSAFVSDSRLSVNFNQVSDEWSLIIQDIKLADEGVYVCLVTTKDLKYNASATVWLNVKTIQISGTTYVEVGQTINLSCNVTGRPLPPHHVTWYKDDEVIIFDPRQSKVKVNQTLFQNNYVSRLEITRVVSIDTAWYTCRSSNDDSDSIHVQVLNG